MRETALMKTIIVFPLLNYHDNSSKVLYLSQTNIFIFIYIFSARINLFHIFDHPISLENNIFTNINY